MAVVLSNSEFTLFKEFIFKTSGIHIKPEKRALVEGRLAKRIRHFNLPSYTAYYDKLQVDKEELQTFIDIITTNETSFFREPHHFEFLKHNLFPTRTQPVRMWSAACSIGAEAYSMAMVADEILTARKIGWDIFCSDINVEVIEKAKSGLYPMKFSDQIPDSYLKKHCLRGFGKQDGYFLIDDHLKERISFKRLNLMEPLGSEIGEFDIIFLRNMLIYFEGPQRKFIVENVVSRLKKGGYLFIGHSESLFNITKCVSQVKPTIYIHN